MIAHPVKNVGTQCWYQCGKKDGKCLFCGEGGLCCRHGFVGNECNGKIGLDKSHHLCTADQRGKREIFFTVKMALAQP